MSKPTFGSLFSGIGGLDRGLEQAGWRCAWQVENDRYCRRILYKHWPGVTKYGDIRSVNFGRLEPVDLIAGGFPCQPVSQAGKRLAQQDERWLWPEFARAIRALRPRLVLVENVPGLLIRGFGDILADLAQSGYDAEWDVLPAAAFGAPHQRNRVFIVAYTNSNRQRIRTHEHQFEQERDTSAYTGIDGEKKLVADTSCPRSGMLSIRPRKQEQTQTDINRDGELVSNANDQRRQTNQPIQHPQVFSWAVLEPSDWWKTEPSMGRVAYGISHRVDRIRVLGNAIVPQVGEWLGKLLMEVIKMDEARRCNVCGEEWEDTGDQECPFCGSADTFIVDETEK